MNKQKFVEYLRSPESLDKATLEQLEALINEYPYFQSARTLLAKRSKQLKLKSAAVRVGSAAVYATDRVLLKRYINDELIFLNPMVVHESHEGDHERDLTAAIKTSRIASAQTKKAALPAPRPAQEPPKPEAEKPRPTTPVASKPAPAEQPPSNLDHIIEELYRDMEELKVNREKLRKIENQLAEEEAVDEAVKKATQKAEDPTREAQSEKKEEIKKASESRSARVSKPAAEADTTKKGTPKKTSPTKAPKAKKAAAAKKPATKKAGDGKDTSEKSSKKEDKGEPKGVNQEEIIANFIKSNPTISPPDRSKPREQVDLSGASTELHPEIASEYLAEIYLEQGKTERAVQIYEALMVRFPKKSIYFADIIKKINQQS